MTTIIIPGEPIAKQRPRFARHGKFTRTYSSQETEEGRFLFHALQQVKEKSTGPLSVVMMFYFGRPKSHFGTGKNSGVLKASSPKYHCATTPDVDNLQKFAMDCLNETAWDDDKQIWRVHAEKHYVDLSKHELPRTEIYIEVTE